MTLCIQPQSIAHQRLGGRAGPQETLVFLRRVEVPVPAPVEPLQTKGVSNPRHFVVTHSHRHGVTTGLVIGQKGQRKPTPAESIKLLQLDFDPLCGASHNGSNVKWLVMWSKRSFGRS